MTEYSQSDAQELRKLEKKICDPRFISQGEAEIGDIDVTRRGMEANAPRERREARVIELWSK